MASYTAGQVESVQLYSGVESQPIEMTGGTHGAATTWYKGDLVKTASGLVNAVASNGAISGIALEAASATSYIKLDIALIDPTAIYQMRAADDDYTARAAIGNKYNLVFTAGDQRVNTDLSNAPDVYVVAIHPSDKHADGSTGIIEGRFLVRFIYTTFTGI